MAPATLYTTCALDTTTAIERFEKLAALPEEQADLALGALLIGAAVEADVDVDRQLSLLDDMASAVRERAEAADGTLAQINVLNDYLFDDLGFTGNNEDYYDPRNSMLHHVLSRRIGIPITLSLLYVEVGARVGVPLVGIGMPGHFLVRHEADNSIFIDPFHRGVMLTEKECAHQFRLINQRVRWQKAFLAPVTKHAFLARVMRNLSAIWVQREELEQAERVLGLLVVLQPDELGHRRDRGMLRHRLGNPAGALEDLEAYLERQESAPDTWHVRGVVSQLRDGGTT